MTRYEQGFITKCAEYGVDGQALLKQAAGPLERNVLIGSAGGAGLVGAALGGVTGALTSKKNRLRRALVGALIGGGIGGGAGYLQGSRIRHAAAGTDSAFNRFEQLAKSGPFKYTEDQDAQRKMGRAARSLGFTGLFDPGTAASHFEGITSDIDSQTNNLQRLIDISNGKTGRWGVIGSLFGAE